MAISKQEFFELDKVLEVNRFIHIIVKTKNKTRVFKSTIADFQGAHIFIYPIAREDSPVALRRGDIIDVVYSASDAVYEFSTQVTGKMKDNNVVLTSLSKPGKCMRVQRRGFFRLDCDIKGAFRQGSIEIRNGKKVFLPQEKAQICYLSDLSGGGISCNTRRELIDNPYIEVVFYAGGNDNKTNKIKEIVKVVRRKKVSILRKRDGFLFLYGCRFVAISEETQAKIVRFVIQRQIEEHKGTH